MSRNTMQELECFISALTDEIERLSGLMKLGTQNLKKSLNAQPSSRDQQLANISGTLTLMDAPVAHIVEKLVHRLNSDEHELNQCQESQLYALRRKLERHLQRRSP
jgi:hypothetical protein